MWWPGHAIHVRYWHKADMRITLTNYAPPAARVAAVTALFDRGWGKAFQSHVGHDGNEIRVTIRQIFESDDKEESLLLEHETPEK